ncbi:MAG: hypothetical protein ACI97A_003695 [Planctomycetota bacterium]|jgi:hypothetical protein
MIYEGDPTIQQARHIIQRMGETGQPPERGALFVNVATNEILELLRKEYLHQMRETRRNSSFKLIQAPFGGGKTQFLMSLREVAWQEGFSTARVDLSPKECPFDKPEKIYEAVAQGIELPPEALDEQPEPGIDVALRTIARARAKEYGADVFKNWLRGEFEESPIENRSFRKAVSMYMAAVVDNDFDKRDLLADYLRGTPVPANELTPLRIREQLVDTNAFGFLKSLVQSLSQLQLPGLVMLFDEMDRNMSLPSKRRRAIGDNLRQMIDQCGQATLPGVLWCYAVPPEFMDTIVPEYPALAQRLKGVAGISKTNPLNPLIDLDRLALGAVDLMSVLGERLVEIHAIGFEEGLDISLQKKNIRALAGEMGSRQLESGTRREFVKAAIRLLSEQANGEEHELSNNELRDFLSISSNANLGALDGEQDIF